MRMTEADRGCIGLASGGLPDPSGPVRLADGAMDCSLAFVASPVAQLVLDPGHRALFANQAWLSRTGVDPVGRPWIDLVHPDDIGGELPLIGRLQIDRLGYRTSTRLAAISGWIDATVEVVPLGDGALATVLPTCHVHAQPAPDAQVVEHRVLTAALSHDLYQHARLANMYLQLLARASLDGPHRRRLDTAIEHVERLVGSQTRLVRWLRLADQALDLVPSDLGFLAVRAAAAFPGHQVGIDALPTIEADPALIEELFTALIGNAVVYAGTAVRIGSLRVDGHWRVEVADHGPGIPQAERLRVLDPLHRLHAWEQVPGYGMGLALASRIMARHGGSLAIEGGSVGGCVVQLDFHE